MKLMAAAIGVFIFSPRSLEVAVDGVEAVAGVEGQPDEGLELAPLVPRLARPVRDVVRQNHRLLLQPGVPGVAQGTHLGPYSML